MLSVRPGYLVAFGHNCVKIIQIPYAFIASSKKCSRQTLVSGGIRLVRLFAEVLWTDGFKYTQ